VWSNSIGGRLCATRVEGTDRQAWVGQLAEELTSTTTMLWGAAYLHPEFVPRPRWQPEGWIRTRTQPLMKACPRHSPPDGGAARQWNTAGPEAGACGSALTVQP
jgi:hypothetical protein